ncbi:zinc-binding dehydrogenase [Amycolatopsis suaedae]|uniref:Oxidoreductase n=1 Tax=Amycolatopsis suaedae TaxID=2510978 RepID=A0A4V2EM50_9PSEU|nr:zinc-binding alcohol dehydrogenase [Amycolatopsis suaedae]RZQ63835.1 oxidoreductase [Amycolatopsis suaedae]
MPSVVQFTGPRQVELAEVPAEPVGPGEVRVRTRFSGISAGTELTAYRGTNPYLTRTWDPERKLFTGERAEAAPRYPLVGWGYSEAGQVVEVGADVSGLRPGDPVWGIWGHRSEAVLPAAKVRAVPDGVTLLAASFARVGAVALNAVLAAQANLGELVAIFGQGVIGLLATQLCGCAGVEVIAVDTLPARRAAAAKAGALLALDPAAEDVAERVREANGGAGADVVIELSGSHPALQEAIRTVGPGGRVVAAGFYQGEGIGLRLGEEFHHNRVELVSSQIGGVPGRLAGRWDQPRLNEVFLRQCARGTVDPAALVSHLLPPSRVGQAYELLDTDPGAALQIVLDFEQE